MFEHRFAEPVLQEYIDGICELNAAFDRIEASATEYFDNEEKVKSEILEKFIWDKINID